MYFEDSIWFANNDLGEKLKLNLKMANRHGLIAGATGTGKTTTLKVLAESFSKAGVPVFTADVKGDLTASSLPLKSNDDIESRLDKFNLRNTNYAFEGFPIEYWDIFGEYGHPIRTTLNDIGPILLSNILDLSDAQEGIINIAFQYAKDINQNIEDIKDMRVILQEIYDHASEITLKYGNVAKQSVGTVVRKLVELENNEANLFFGKPALDINDFIRLDGNGKGFINLLECSKLFQRPKLYTTFMVWLLDNLYNTLPEVGDLEKPKLVFFFDESHLLFNDAPKSLLDKITQTVKLIRSKGVGVYFISQAPTDIPDCVLSQLSNRIQHCLHAYTPAEQKKLKLTCDTFRENDRFKVIDIITNLGVGEALSTMLDENGIPGIVEKAYILPPQSCFGPLDDVSLKNNIYSSYLDSKYRNPVEDISAYEEITERKKKEEEEKAEQLEKEEKEKAEKKAKEEEKKKNEKIQKEIKSTIKSAGRTAINTTVRRAVNSIIKNIFK